MKLKGLKLFPEHGNITQLKRVKFGIDPTTSKLHLGHLVPLMVVKKLKEEKKDITIVLGNFTAQLGDPTGQEKTRPILSDIQIENNTEQIIKQIKNVLGDCRIVKNKDFMTSISANNFIKDVITKFNLSELLQRENFKNRGVALQELIVPLCQAMDSVFLETEIEVGGEDQMINFGITRQLQRSFGIKEEVCILCPIIKGTDGNKMSKSK
jgi:tyrosyl-tRNA synthetase